MGSAEPPGPPPCVGPDKKKVDTTISVFFNNRERTCITIGIQTSGAPNKNIVQNHLNIALLNVF